MSVFSQEKEKGKGAAKVGSSRQIFLLDVPLCAVILPRMFCFLKGVSAVSLEQSQASGVSAGKNTSQA